MAGELLLAWIALGLAGGVLLHRGEKIDPSAWPFAALLGPGMIFLGLWEYRRRNQ